MITYIPPHPPLTSPPATTNVSSPASTPPLSLSIPDPHPQHTRRPSQCVLDILQGKATDLLPARGVQLPTSIPETADHNPASFEGEQPTQLVSMVTNYNDDVELVLNLNEVIANAEALEPTSIAEAQRRPEWPQWEQGIRKELATLQKAGTWELVDPPQGANIVGSK